MTGGVLSAGDTRMNKTLVKVTAEPHGHRPRQGKVGSGLTVLQKLCCRWVGDGQGRPPGRGCGITRKSFLEGTVLELRFEGQAGTAKRQ